MLDPTRKASPCRPAGNWPALFALFLAMTAWPLMAQEPTEDEFPSRESAIAEIERVLDAAAISLGDRVKRHEAPVNRPMACPAAMAGKVSAASSIQLKLDIDRKVEPRSLLEVMDEFWKKAGLDTYLDAERSQQPTLRTSFDGYNIALRVAEKKREAYLIGVTPCLPYGEPPLPRSPLDHRKDG